MLYIEKLFLRGRLGTGAVAVRRLRAAQRIVSDYEFSGFMPSIPCCLSPRFAHAPSNRDANVDRVSAADRYIEASRVCGPLFFPLIRHFVLDDLSLADWAAVNYLPNNGRTADEACARLSMALDRVGQAYEALFNKERAER